MQFRNGEGSGLALGEASSLGGCWARPSAGRWVRLHGLVWVGTGESVPACPREEAVRVCSAVFGGVVNEGRSHEARGETLTRGIGIETSRIGGNKVGGGGNNGDKVPTEFV